MQNFIEVFAEEFPWLLNEKCKSIWFEMIKWWQLIKRINLILIKISYISINVNFI